MIPKHSLRMRIIVVLSVFAFGLPLIGAIPAAAQGFVVVANKQLGVSSISATEINAIFLGKKLTWSSGERVALAIYDDPGTQEKFLKQYLNKTPDQFKTYWKQMVFTGKAGMPAFLKTPADVVAFVKANPGAVSFLVPPAGESIKTLKIN